jgi:hypothetical protein
MNNQIKLGKLTGECFYLSASDGRHFHGPILTSVKLTTAPSWEHRREGGEEQDCDKGFTTQTCVEEIGFHR